MYVFHAHFPHPTHHVTSSLWQIVFINASIHVLQYLKTNFGERQNRVCHFCGERGHLARATNGGEKHHYFKYFFWGGARGK